MLSSEVGDLADEVRRIFIELGRTSGEALTGECTPGLDLYETDEALELVVDLPGVDASAIRVVIRADAVLVAGEKAPRRSRSESSFHLVERGFGRFARAVRLGHTCDASRARATLAAGELRVSIPKVADRRGRAFRVPVEAALDTPARVQ